MKYSRRDFGKFALGSIPVASAVLADPRRFFAAQAKPNSKINGVQIGVISYSYRSMPDQSAEAVLGYITADGISACELETPVWPYAYKRLGYTPQLAVASQGEREGAAELRRLRLHRARLFPDNLHGMVKRARRAVVAVAVRPAERQQLLVRRELPLRQGQHQAVVDKPAAVARH